MNVQAWAETGSTNPLLWVMKAMIQLASKQLVSSGRAAQRSRLCVERQEVAVLNSSEQDIAAAKAERDKMHTTKLSAKVHAQMQAHLDVEARKQAALQWFYRQFRIRGGKGWGLGSKAGRPSDADKYLTPRAV